MTSRKELPTSFVARLANLCSMPENDMAMILNRMVTDGYMKRITKGKSYVIADLPEPATAVQKSVNDADRRIAYRRTPPPAVTITASMIPGATERIVRRARPPLPRNQPAPVRDVLKRQAELARGEPDG